MEFQKNTSKFSFGAGSIKMAGAGKASESEPVQNGTADKIKIAKTAAVAVGTAAVFLLKMKNKRK